LLIASLLSGVLTTSIAASSPTGDEESTISLRNQTAPQSQTFLPPFQLSDRTPSSTASTSPNIDETFFGNGGGIVITDPEEANNLHLYVGALGSPESEWSIERKDVPNQTVSAFSSQGIIIKPTRPGQLSIEVEYRVSGGMVTEASYWASGVVPRSLVDGSLQLAEDYLIETILDEWSRAVAVLINIIEALFTFSLADETTSLTLTTRGGTQNQINLMELRCLDAHPSFPVLLDPGEDRIVLDESRRLARMDIEAMSTDSIEVWLELKTLAKVWGWASAGSNFDVWIDRIVVTGEAIRPLPVESTLDGVVYDESDPRRFERHGDESLWTVDVAGNQGSRFLVKNENPRGSVSGFWRLNPTTEGFWETFVFVSSDSRATRSASYIVEHSGKVDTVIVNQLEHQGEWVSLGEYFYAAQGDEGIRLDNATLEPSGTATVIYDSAGLVWKGQSSDTLALPCGIGAVPLSMLVIAAAIRRKNQL